MPLGRIGSDFLVNTTGSGQQTNVRIAGLVDGNFVAIWQSTDTGDGSGLCVRARVFDADGNPLGADFRVNSTTSGDQAAPSVTALPDGSFVASWVSADGGGAMRARFFGADGTPNGNDFIVNSTATGIVDQSSGAASTVVTLARPDGSMVAVWLSTDGADGSASCIRARLFDDDGTPIGSDFVVNSTADGQQERPEIVNLDGGGFIAVWVSFDGADGSGSCIRARRFGPDGTPAGTDFVVNTTTSGNQSYPSVTQLADNRVLVSWQSADTGDGSESCIRARIYEADGTPAGNDFIVNSSTTDGQSRVSVVGLADGRFVAAWTDNDVAADGSGLAIRARIFDSDGTPVFKDFVVNTVTDNGQLRPSVTQLADGRIVIGWTSQDGGGSSVADIRAQIFDPSIYEGTSGGDSIRGTAAAESLFGLGGNDTLAGRDGNDRLEGGAGADYLSGGAGSDTAVYATAASGVAVSLANPAVNTGDALGDTYNSVENLTGSSFNDGLAGNNSANVINGGGGNDAVKGYGGDDRLFGADGNDTLLGGAGADYLSGGAGSDTASYAGATARVIVSLANPAINSGEAAGDTFNSIENLTGSSYGDYLFGNNGHNVIHGGSGNDIIKSYGGNDTLTGGAGADIFVFNSALDTATNVDTITDFNVVDDTIQLENAIFTALAATGVLAASAFKDVAGGGVKDADDRIIYNSNTGALYYDADGSGIAFGNVKVATLTGGPDLTAADFVVV
jgi:Ca2+-binding RTX toxin-like protein